MRKLLKISGGFLLLAAIFYLAMFFFPSYFHPQIQRSSVSHLLESQPETVTPTSARDFVILTCGENCSQCNGSGTGCAEFMIEQARLLCNDGKKGDAICYYDLLTLTQACHNFCDALPKTTLPKIISPL